VLNVTERQFDYNDEKLHELGRTPYDEIDFDDLWYYHHDLAYVELQPDLFAYLFPVCLMDWHRTLLANEPCSHGDSEFHYGVIRGNVLEKMLTAAQREDVEAVLRDSMLYRLDQERMVGSDGMHMSAFAWMARLNSLGLISRALPRIWQSWWMAGTCGRAVAVLQYCSGLMYFDYDNPLLSIPSGVRNINGQWLWENDSHVWDRGWRETNVAFVRDFVTAERVVQVIRDVAEKLRNEP
jgi:hypothetical protein